MQRPTGTWLSKHSNMSKLQESTKPYTLLQDQCVEREESEIIEFPLPHAVLLGVGDESSQGSLCIGRVSLFNVRVVT